MPYMVSHPFPSPQSATKSNHVFFQSVVTENGQVVGGVPFVKMKTDQLGVLYKCI